MQCPRCQHENPARELHLAGVWDLGDFGHAVEYAARGLTEAGRVAARVHCHVSAIESCQGSHR
jgi:hypothetical protein